MLHRAKVLEQLRTIKENLFVDCSADIIEAYRVWQQIACDVLFKSKVNAVATYLELPQWHNLLSDTIKIPAWPEAYAIAGVDGSQIFPDRHQGSSCFLINVGTVRMRYRTQAYAQLHTQPYVFAGTAQEHESFFSGSISPDNISCYRHVLELQHGYELMHTSDDVIQLLLLDGSLLFWHLASKSQELQQYFALQYMHILEKMYQQMYLVAGYISLPHSKELVSLVQFSLADCNAPAFQKLTALETVLDKHIIACFVPVGSRTGVFKSNAAIAALYPEHLRPYFFYMQGSQEIARVEIPAWIALDTAKVDIVAALIQDQMEKGQGYPISLAEAHEQAVVKGPDRDFFYHLVTKLSIEQKRTIISSQKSLKKRIMTV